MKNNYIYVVRGYMPACSKAGYDRNELGYWLSLGTAKADIKRMKENGILNAYYELVVEQIQIGRYHVPDIKLHQKKTSKGWVNVD